MKDLDLQYFKDMGNTYRIGSHMYGLNNEKSDIDEMIIYFDSQDYLNPIRTLPDVKEMDNNNTKLYALDHFARLLLKGNPNLVEIVQHKSQHVCSSEVLGFMKLMYSNQDILVHRGVADAYMGHLNGIVKEFKTKGVTPKRLSHSMRIVFSLLHVLETGKLYSIIENSSARNLCFRIKNHENTSEVAPTVHKCIVEVEDLYNKKKDKLPDNKALKSLINEYFRGLYL